MERPIGAAHAWRHWSNDGPPSNAAAFRESADQACLGLRLFLSAQAQEGTAMTTKTKAISRRALLRTSGTAALLAAANTSFPFGAHIAQAAGPEVTKANLGFIALTDAAPL